MGFLNLAIFGHGLGFGIVGKILDCCCLISFGWELEFSFEVRGTSNNSCMLLFLNNKG